MYGTSINGFSKVELLVALAIVAILSAIGIAVARPAKESANKQVCASQLRQLYIGFALYASDSDSTSTYPELHGLAYLGPRAMTDFMIDNKGITWCASAPKSWRPTPTTCSYIVALTYQDGRFTNRERMIEQEKKLGSSAGIVYCSVHDELFVAPNEKDIHPSLTRSLYQELCLDGRVVMRRSDQQRDFIFLNSIRRQ